MPPQMSSQPINAGSQAAVADRAKLPFADGRQIADVLLTDWLAWVTQKNRDVFVARPMIQRGSVWKANAIADLWDSLLRGMPIGSLTVYRNERRKDDEMTRPWDQEKAKNMPIPEGSLFLLDGQQRTLAMLIGWPWEKEMYRRVWVDFGQPGATGQQFRLQVTTEYQPFGFNPNDQSKKLQRWERRKARDDFNRKDENITKFNGIPDYKLPLDKTEPYGTVHPLEFRSLIQNWQNTGQNIETWVQNCLKLRPLPDAKPKEEIEKRIRAFGKALQNLFQTRIALIRVTEELVKHVGDDENDSEPALVVLFRRIANGGTPLSNSDYVFSLIKHRFPDAHNLVQELYEEQTLSSLLSENDLVMTAVRLAANTHTHDGGIPFTDNPSPNPTEFGRMLKRKIDKKIGEVGDGDFLGSALMPLIKRDSSRSLHKAFKEVHRLLEFRDNSNLSDAGLPKLAFPLLQHQLVQVILFWIHLQHRGGKSDELLMQQFEASRSDVLRFVLFWLLCVKDKEAASKISFKLLQNYQDKTFPGEELYKQICKEDLAIYLQRPDTIESSAISPPATSQKVRCRHTRFDKIAADGSVTESQPLYRRWFEEKHLLLWLQRKTLVVEFKDANPVAGREEETPYDYDHICPWADWGKAGYGSGCAFRDFCENGDYGIVGNSIGNLRVWDSSSNRSDGEAPAPCKLRLFEEDLDIMQKYLDDSGIIKDEIDDWKACSVVEVRENVCTEYCGENSWARCSIEPNVAKGHWNEARALAFQKVVEERAFRLYKQYFKEAGFDEWVSPQSHTEKSGTEISDKIVENLNTTTNIQP